MTYSEVFSRLTFETAAIIFLKKDGTVRVMFGTRNLQTIKLLYGFQGQALGGHDTRCNINNGNIAVYDLELGDARSFNIGRLVSINYVGVISTNEEYITEYEKFKQYKEKYEKNLETITEEEKDKQTSTDNTGKEIWNAMIGKERTKND